MDARIGPVASEATSPVRPLSRRRSEDDDGKFESELEQQGAEDAPTAEPAAEHDAEPDHERPVSGPDPDEAGGRLDLIA